MRLDRLLSIVIMLLNRERISAKELAEHFEVTVRTIYRDVDAINMAGIPIVSFQGNNGGLGIMKNYKLDRQLLTLNDMISILSVLKSVNHTFKDKQLNGAIEKIHNLIPEDKQAHVQNQLGQVVIDVLPWGISAKQKKVMQRVQQALSQNQLIKINYRDSNGKERNRIVESLTLILKAYNWYLFGYCRLRKDFRLFRLTRILRIEILNKPFIRKVADYKLYEEKSYESLKLIKLELKFDPQIQHRVEDYYDDNLLVKEKDGSLRASITLPENDWLYGMLLSYGEYVEVVHPAYVRKVLEEKSVKIAAIYQT